MENLENLPVAFGKIVRKKRKFQELQQAALADLAGIDRSYMGMIERGETSITLEKVYKLARALECDVAELLPFAR
jgi:transcriptional regulator with XRE-family HTH domain